MWIYVAIVVGAGLSSCILSITAGTGSLAGLMLGYLAPIPLFLAGLSRGALAAAIAGGVGTIAAVAFVGFGFGVNFLALFGFPVALITRQALLWRQLPGGDVAWYPLGRLALVLPALAIAYFLAAMAIVEFTGQNLVHVIEQEILQPIAAAYFAADQAGALLHLAPVVPAVMAVSWMLLLIINGALAQGLLKRFGLNQRPLADIAELRLPFALLPVFVLAVLLASLSGPLGMIGKTLAAVGAVPYFLAGLAAIHGWAKHWRGRAFLLVILYGVILIVFWPLCILIVGVGLWQQIVGLRQGKRGGNGQEDQ